MLFLFFIFFSLIYHNREVTFQGKRLRYFILALFIIKRMGTLLGQVITTFILPHVRLKLVHSQRKQLLLSFWLNYFKFSVFIFMEKDFYFYFASFTLQKWECFQWKQAVFSYLGKLSGGGRAVRRCWINFQCRGDLQF